MCGMKFSQHIVSIGKGFWGLLCVIVAVNAAVFFFGLFPFYEKIQSLASEISATQGKIARLDGQKEHFTKIERAFLEEEGSTFKRIEATLLDINSPLQFIELIEELGREQGITAKIVVRDAPKNGFQKFQIIVEGEFPRLFQYLRVLEFLPYQVTFVSMQVTSSKIQVVPEELPATGQKFAPSQKTVSKMGLDISVRIKR